MSGRPGSGTIHEGWPRVIKARGTGPVLPDNTMSCEGYLLPSRSRDILLADRGRNPGKQERRHEMAQIPWQVGVTIEDEPVRDLLSAQTVVAALIPGATIDGEVAVDADAGQWLVNLPAADVVDITFSGGFWSWEGTDPTDSSIEWKIEVELP